MWMFQGLSSNELAHMLNGNRNRSYDKENLPSVKINYVKDFLRTNYIQEICLIEADLHADQQIILALLGA